MLASVRSNYPQYHVTSDLSYDEITIVGELTLLELFVPSITQSPTPARTMKAPQKEVAAQRVRYGVLRIGLGVGERGLPDPRTTTRVHAERRLQQQSIYGVLRTDTD
jgi:hypothetical protein